MESSKQSSIDNCSGSSEDKVALRNVGSERPAHELQMGTNTPTESWARSHASYIVQIICLHSVYVLRLRVVWMD